MWSDTEFAALVKEYAGFITGCIRQGGVKDKDAIEDVAQDVYERAWRYRHIFRGECSFTTWMYAIIKNCLLYKWEVKNRTITTVNLDELLLKTDIDETSSGDVCHRQFRPYLADISTPETYACESQMEAAVLSVYTALSSDRKETWELFDIYGANYKEIAAVLDIPIGTVRSRIFRAREAFDKTCGPLLMAA